MNKGILNVIKRICFCTPNLYDESQDKFRNEVGTKYDSGAGFFLLMEKETENLKLGFSKRHHATFLFNSFFEDNYESYDGINQKLRTGAYAKMLYLKRKEFVKGFQAIADMTKIDAYDGTPMEKAFAITAYEKGMQYYADLEDGSSQEVEQILSSKKDNYDTFSTKFFYVSKFTFKDKVTEDFILHCPGGRSIETLNHLLALGYDNRPGRIYSGDLKTLSTNLDKKHFYNDLKSNVYTLDDLFKGEQNEE